MCLGPSTTVDNTRKSNGPGATTFYFFGSGHSETQANTYFHFFLAKTILQVYRICPGDGDFAEKCKQL